MRDILLAALKVAVSTLANLLGWMLAVKIISFESGAAGVGLFGLLRQLLQYLVVVTTFAGTTAIIQGVASREGEAQRRYLGSVQTIMLLMVVGGAGILFLGAPYFATRLIPHPQAIQLLRWLALASICMSAQALYTSVLTGHRLLNQLVVSQLVGPVFAVVLVLPMLWLVRNGDSAGYVLMLGLPAAGVAMAAGWSAAKAACLPAFRMSIQMEDAAYFFRMSTVLMATGIVTTGAQYFMNWMVAGRLGLEMAGFYWTAWTLSMAYVTLALGSFGNYYMPSLTRLSDPAERRALMRSYLLMVLVAMPALVSLAILFKPLVVRVLFSAALLPALQVMRWMLLGDLFKGVAWVLSFPMLAFQEMKWFFWSEVLFTLGMAGVGWLVIAFGGGIEGLGMSFLVLYFGYMVTMMVYAYTKHGFVMELNEAFHLAAGILLLCLISTLTWHQQTMTLGSTAIGLGLISLFLTYSIRRGAIYTQLFSKQDNEAQNV